VRPLFRGPLQLTPADALGLAVFGPVPLPGPWPAGLALSPHSREGDEGRTAVGDLLDRFKYGGERALARPLAQALAAALTGRGAGHRAPGAGVVNDAPTGHTDTSTFQQVEVIVHVPATTARLRVPPTCDLARALAREMRVRCLPHFLACTRKLAHQKDLSRFEDKRQNVRAAFQVRRADFITGKKLLLLDDVYDSGATLEEVWRVLMQAGAGEVVVAAITKTRYRRDA
jgi:predicted amidophosphoribosyltransferase